MLLADHKSLEEGGITSTLGVSQDPPQGSKGGPHPPELTEEKGTSVSSGGWGGFSRAGDGVGVGGDIR